MTAPNPALIANAAFAKLGVQLAGVPVIFNRISGYAPNVTTVASASITAIVRMMTPDSTAVAETGYSAHNAGSISQDDRLVIVMADDLTAADFPLPVMKGDRVVLSATSEEFEVTKVDPYKRALTGAIEVTIAGVS